MRNKRIANEKVTLYMAGDAEERLVKGVEIMFKERIRILPKLLGDINS